ncbi:unnamed protein product [Adineta steineri]|uniref:Uncharacterized protein n=1 Tax=Adineta steineri TaxID=433720 RepID=A0A818MFM9_9BILA|nr:unnamed protein product [Adineta steineri]CAF1317252.1 unnamed protein product [Adineta steineri]CAF3554404.1 unnamed protein product [Adineta steineri]CAF3586761.1 unnamed protein product [Adineta steineri]
MANNSQLHERIIFHDAIIGNKIIEEEDYEMDDDDNDNDDDDEMKALLYLDPSIASIIKRNKQYNTAIVCEKECHSRLISDLLKIPDFLSMKNNDYKFQDMVEQKISSSTDIFNIKMIQIVAILIYQLHVLDLENCLWNTCLKIDTSHLQKDQNNLKVWPLRIRTMIQFARCSTNISNSDKIQFTDENRLDFIGEHLRNLNQKQQQIKQELMKHKINIVGFTDNLEQILQTFVKDNTQFVRLQYSLEIKLLKFDHHEQLFDYKFQKQNPTSKQTNNNKLLQILSNIQRSLSTAIESLTDMELQNYMFNCYQQDVQQYRQEINKIIIDTMQTELDQFQKLFANEIAAMWQCQRLLSMPLQIDQTMLDLIERHLLLINEKIQCIYDYKEAACII